jgi:hypothetical protein
VVLSVGAWVLAPVNGLTFRPVAPTYGGLATYVVSSTK